MWWKFSRKSVLGRDFHKKTRKLRLESLEQRQMLSVASPIGHFLHGPLSPGLYGPPSPGQHEQIREATRVNAKVEAGGVTQVTLDMTEDLYAGSNRSHLIAKEDVQIVADVKGVGDLRIDANESESVVVQGGNGLSIENLVQSVDVNVTIGTAGHFQIDVHESESVATCSGRGLSIDKISQSQDVYASFEGHGRLSLNVDEAETIFAQSQQVRGNCDPFSLRYQRQDGPVSPSGQQAAQKSKEMYDE